ncbi:MAG: alpha/beta fold hydrolase [Saprospiraceae bacterium]|nr:alpha/beta fold hydrolase [Saprospiraceae bacterium]
MKSTLSLFRKVLILLTIPLFTYGQTLPEVSLSDLVGDPNIKQGYIEVPMNHNDPSGKKIKIGYAIAPSRSKDPGHPVILFTGGPGEFTVKNFHNYKQFPLVDEHDLILFDQRGTGYSHALYNMGPDVFKILCSDLSLTEEYQKMKNLANIYRDSIQDTGLDLRYINTTQNAHDVGMLMDHLDYDQYIFMGGSYGTKIARRTMDLYPDKVNAAILMAPATYEDDFLTFRIKNYQRALNLTFQKCKEDAACNSKYPNLAIDYVEAIKALEDSPIPATVDGQTFYINPQDAMYMLRYQLYTPQAQKMAPAFIKALKDRDTSSINASQGFLSFVFDAVNFSMNISIGRYEEYNTSITRDNIDSYYNDPAFFPSQLGFFNAIYFATAEWHQYEATDDEINFKSSTIPSLILVNKFDPVTPPQNGYDFLKDLKKGQLLVIDEGGHSGGGNCQWEVMNSFLTAPSVPVSASCFKLVDRRNGWE